MMSFWTPRIPRIPIMFVRAYHVHVRWHVRKDMWALWIAHRMPRWLVRWCAVRLGAHATTGSWSDQVVPELTFLDALKRWDLKTCRECSGHGTIAMANVGFVPCPYCGGEGNHG